MMAAPDSPERMRRKAPDFILLTSAVAPDGALTDDESDGAEHGDPVAQVVGLAGFGEAGRLPSSGSKSSPSTTVGGLCTEVSISDGSLNRPIWKAHQPAMAAAAKSVTAMNIAA